MVESKMTRALRENRRTEEGKEGRKAADTRGIEPLLRASVDIRQEDVESEKAEEEMRHNCETSVLLTVLDI